MSAIINAITGLLPALPSEPYTLQITPAFALIIILLLGWLGWLVFTRD